MFKRDDVILLEDIEIIGYTIVWNAVENELPSIQAYVKLLLQNSNPG